MDGYAFVGLEVGKGPAEMGVAGTTWTMGLGTEHQPRPRPIDYSIGTLTA
jgi:hypothetical protein